MSGFKITYQERTICAEAELAGVSGRPKVLRVTGMTILAMAIIYAHHSFVRISATVTSLSSQMQVVRRLCKNFTHFVRRVRNCSCLSGITGLFGQAESGTVCHPRANMAAVFVSFASSHAVSEECGGNYMSLS